MKVCPGAPTDEAMVQLIAKCYESMIEKLYIVFCDRKEKWINRVNYYYQ